MEKRGKKFADLRPLIPYPALLFDDKSYRILIVVDLHIGFEHELAQDGIYIPSQTPKILKSLLQVLDEGKPDELIILGDVKQAIPRISLREWKDVPEFFDAIGGTVKKVSVVLGNHDGNLGPLTPSSVRIIPSSGIVVGKKRRIGLFHGHAWPTPKVLATDILIMGHIHPVVRFYDRFGFSIVRQVWVRTRCNGEKLAQAYLKYAGIKFEGDPKEHLKGLGANINDPTLILMPAFNEALGGMAVNRIEKKWMGPVLNSGGVNIEGAELYLLDGTYISTVGRLPARF